MKWAFSQGDSPKDAHTLILRTCEGLLTTRHAIQLNPIQVRIPRGRALFGMDLKEKIP